MDAADAGRGQTERTYDTVAEAYAERFFLELDGKPFDRGLLQRFARMVPTGGRVLDAGCGPGHIARHLHRLGLDVVGVDISAGMVDLARRLVPEAEFVHGDVLALPFSDGAFSGCVAMYSLHHLPAADLPRGLAEIRRVLGAGAPLLVAVHRGTGGVHVDEFLGHPVPVDGVLYQPDEVADHVTGSGFGVVTVCGRPPYPDIEAAYERIYVLAQ